MLMPPSIPTTQSSQPNFPSSDLEIFQATQFEQFQNPSEHPTYTQPPDNTLQYPNLPFPPDPTNDYQGFYQYNGGQSANVPLPTNPYDVNPTLTSMANDTNPYGNTTYHNHPTISYDQMSFDFPTTANSSMNLISPVSLPQPPTNGIDLNQFTPQAGQWPPPTTAQISYPDPLQEPDPQGAW